MYGIKYDFANKILRFWKIKSSHIAEIPYYISSDSDIKGEDTGTVFILVNYSV